MSSPPPFLPSPSPSPPLTLASPRLASPLTPPAGKKRPLPQTVDEKIEEALRLKLEGNEAFKAGE